MAIERLPQSVADAIAAGEVVERPASVVKELCENAIDAGATRLDIVVDGAGTVRIRVIDDGCGISSDQLRLAVARHATSKIRTAADLEAVGTLGFRGEALASIAAVADLALFSRTTAAGSGHRLRVRHGETVEEGGWGGPRGTTVEVLDLFAATPARLRFLRSDRAETAASLTVATELVLMHPALAVTCTIDGRHRLRTPGGSLDEALRCVFGAEASELLPVAAQADINVGGAISEPRQHRGTRGGLVLVVNGRRVHNRTLLAAIDDAYRGLVPTGRHPFGVVSVELDPADVDVNVHPTKREVRLRNERAVFAAVQRACWQALRAASVYASWPGDDSAAGPAGASGAVQGADAALRVADNAVPALGSPQGGDQGTSPGGNHVASQGADHVSQGANHGTSQGGDSGRPWMVPVGGAAPGGPEHPAGQTALAAANRLVAHSTLADLAPLRALGQQEGRWLLATSAKGIVIVDPHAAHEKVLYAALLASWATGFSPQQMLLMPELVECDAIAIDLYAAHEQLIAGYGFLVEPFGPTTLRCSAVPAGASAAQPGRLLTALLGTLGGGPVTEQRHRAAALIACHSAVRFGDELSAVEQQRLLDQLLATAGGVACPHGRPALILLDEATLRRTFRRPPA